MTETTQERRGPFNQRVYRLVAKIPYGRVMTYGQIACLIGHPGAARQVGYALAATPEALSLPWHRVINAQGQVSRRADPDSAAYQRVLLEAEGVLFDNRGRVALNLFSWTPRTGSQNALNDNG